MAIARRKGDIIQVRLFDEAYNKYFESDARVEDKKSIKQLIKDLKDKGVSLKDDNGSWF